MTHYYNEFDEFASQWMANLAKEKLIPAGKFDTRSIKDVAADDLAGFRQCHFFAGIAGWPLALRLAGWPEDKEVWTGSCPCQPFSSAGKRRGTDDERHLWPEFRRLIAQCRPAIVFGEQVASKDGREWLSGVRTDLEDLGYAVGAADLCAAGVGAPHIRQRLFWVADAASASGPQHEREPRGRSSAAENDSVDQWDSGRMADSGHESAGRAAGSGETENWWSFGQPAGRGDVQRLGDTIGDDLGRNAGGTFGEKAEGEPGRQVDGDGRQQSGQPGSAHWSLSNWIPCRDGKARPTVPGVRLLAHGFPNRVGLLRGFGNAIVPQVAAEFVKAFMELKT